MLRHIFCSHRCKNEGAFFANKKCIYVRKSIKMCRKFIMQYFTKNVNKFFLSDFVTEAVKNLAKKRIFRLTSGCGLAIIF